VSSWALVPIKARSEAKRRLSGALGETARTALVRAMLENVLEALGGCPAIEEIAVVSPERDVLPAAFELLPDPGQGLNFAVEESLRSLAARGAERIVIVAADLPLLSADDIASLVAASSRASVALAPDRSGSGTNALGLTLPTRFRFHFGPGSLPQHLAEAARLGLKPVAVRRPGLAFDVDEPEDVTLLKGYAVPRYGFLD